MSDVLTRVWDQIDTDFDDHLELIRSYLRQPSVSVTGEGIGAASGLTAGLVERAGGKAEIVATAGHPVVIGEVEGAGPALLRYGMYDVQPADEPGWTVAPFAAEVRDLPGVGSVVVARGAANSKGCLSAFFCALMSLRKVAEMPVTVKLMLDGEEEIGSPHLPGVLDAHRDRLSAEAAFDLDLMADRASVPEIFLGCKGIVSLKLVCGGGDWGGPIDAALHSSEGAVIASPAWRLIAALNAIVDADERPLVSMAGAAAPTAEDEALLDDLAGSLDPAAELRASGARAHKISSDARSLAYALCFAPVVNLNGISGGDADSGKTIVPHRVQAVIDFRVPYGASVEEVLADVQDRVSAAAPEVEVLPFELCPPAKTSPNSSIAKAMITSHEAAGSPARVWPSAPWWAPYYLFEQTLGLPFAIGGAGHCGGAHAPDEYASIEGLRAHMKQAAALLFRYAEEGGE